MLSAQNQWRPAKPAIRHAFELVVLLVVSVAALLGPGSYGSPERLVLMLAYPLVGVVVLRIRRRRSRHPHAILGAPMAAGLVMLGLGTVVGEAHPVMASLRLWLLTAVFLGAAAVLLDVVEARLPGISPPQLPQVDVEGPRFALKYLIERVVAAIALVVLLPVLAAAALAVHLSSPGPVIFR